MGLALKLEKQLLDRREQFLLRRHTAIESCENAHLVIEGKRYLSFSSNNYLGLAKHPAVIKACQEALTTYGVGSGSAYLISGYTAAHQELETRLANFLRYPRVLLLSSGYLANIGVISALLAKGDQIYSDKLNHASIIDGCLLSRANLKRYPHCRPKILEQLISTSPVSNKLVVSEGVFSMNGTVAPLKQLADIASKYQAWTLIDDAHGIGVLGKSGRGSIEYHQLDHTQIPILIGTLGKAFGTYGAFVAGESLFIEHLIQATRTYLYTTAIPPAIAAASIASLSLIEKEDWRREKLFELISYFKQQAAARSLPYLDSPTQIQGILIGSNEKALIASQKLAKKGIYLKAIRPPTVPPLQARLRISLTTDHTIANIDFLIEALVDALTEP